MKTLWDFICYVKGMPESCSLSNHKKYDTENDFIVPQESEKIWVNVYKTSDGEWVMGKDIFNSKEDAENSQYNITYKTICIDLGKDE